MSDYRIKVTVRNARILKAIEADGHPSVAAFCKSWRLPYQQVIDLIALRISPITKSGNFGKVAKQLMDALCALPQDLWTVEQLNMELGHNTWQRDVSSDGMNAIDAEHCANKLLAGAGLKQREQDVLYSRFTHDATLEEAGKVIGRTRERVRQIENRALRKLLHAAGEIE